MDISSHIGNCSSNSASYIGVIESDRVVSLIILDTSDHNLHSLIACFSNNSREYHFADLMNYLFELYDPSDLIVKDNANINHDFLISKGFVLSEFGFEWFNPNMTHYVYKITATDSGKYYYGVSHVKKANATIDDCLNDGYYGSGGKKFQNWKKKHYRTLTKEIVKVFQHKKDAYIFEKEIIADLYKEDKNCLNSIQGGFIQIIPRNSKNLYTVKECVIHKKNTVHQGNNCRKCITNKSTPQKLYCIVHGISNHIGEKCLSCISSKKNTLRLCSIHGKTMHQLDKCYLCIQKSLISIKKCEKHGETKFQRDICSKCNKDNNTHLNKCEIHGKTKFQGRSCYMCSSDHRIIMKNCDTHGRTKFYDKDTCAKCAIKKKYKIQNCSIHGKVMHVGEKCKNCLNMKTAHTRFHTNKPNQKCKYCIFM